VHPKLAGDSAAVVRRLLAFGSIQNLTAGQSGTRQDFGRPLYFSSPGDPVFTLACTRPSLGPCLGLEQRRIHVPDAARPAGGSDAHMSVIDQPHKLEYDLWQVQSKPRGGGVLRFSAGGVISIDGDGRGSGAVAAGYGTAAGLVREEELASGQINHALFMFVHCDSGRAVYPAQRTGESCAQLGEPNADAPPEGARFQLAMSDAQIAQLPVPAWNQTILRAMARYGMVVGDTGGQWGSATESGLVYTSFGQPDRWVSFSRAVGAPYYAPDGDYVLNLADGVDWARYLHVVAPCVSAGSC